MKRRKLGRIFSKALFLLCMTFSLAWAEDTPLIIGDSDRTDVVITYTREKSRKEDVAATIEVITQEDMKKIPASNASEVLQYVPGVYVEFNAGLGSQATASIQGSDPRQVAVFMDGVALNLLANPMVDLSTIPVANIERIEVYKGAASAAWGSGLGGVINIVTKEPDPTKPFTGEIQSSLGQYTTNRSSGTVSGTVERFGYLVSLSHDQTDGFVPHSDYRQDAAYTKFHYLIGNSSRLSFVYSYDEGKHHNPSPWIIGWGFWEDLFQTRSYERLLFESQLSDSLAWSIEGRYLESDMTSRYEPISGGWDYSEWRWGISSRMRHEIKDVNHLVVGFDGDWGGYNWSSYTTKFDSGNWALYVNDTLDIKSFSLIAGVRYDNNLDFGSEVSPMGGVVYHFSKMGALARFQVGRGFNAPPGSWVHDPTYGNPNLRAESGINYQLGAEIKPLKFLKLELNLFQSDIDNLINYDPNTQHWANIDKATRRGIEGRIGTAFDAGPASGLALSFGGSFIDVRNGDTGKVIPDIPRNLYDITGSYTYKSFTNSLVGRFVFQNSSVAETHDEVFVFDYLLRVKLPSICQAYTPGLFFAVHNLTDADYVYRTFWPQPGRWFEGGMRLEF